MLTVGIDLAAQPLKTAVAWLDWNAEGASVKDLVVGADDDQLVAAVLQSDKAGIDCPLGWPEPFVAFIGQHLRSMVPVPDGTAGPGWSKHLAFRRTDLAVQEAIGKWPLAVAADRIGRTAMRCAVLQARLADAGCRADRCGDGVVVEVYPAASLKQWGLPHVGYKRFSNVAALGRLVDDLLIAAPWLRLGDHKQLCRKDDDALDAVIAALTARAAAKSLTTRPSADQWPIARLEGWIAVPTTPLGSLGP